MHRSSVRSKPGKTSICLVLSILMILTIIPVGHSTASNERDQNTDPIKIRILSIPEMIPSDGPGLMDINIFQEGEAIIGFSSGDRFEIIVDPTPGAPEIPWIALHVKLEGDITGHKITRSVHHIGSDMAGLRTIPRATTPWEPEQKWGSWDGNGNYPKDPILIQHIGYERVNGHLLHSYSIWITPFQLDQNSLGHSSEIEVDLTYSEMNGPTPSRVSGDPADVPGTLSISSNLEVNPEYLIITREETKEELDVLAQWRNNMGVASSVVTVEEIYEHYSGSEDNADLVRTYIKDVLDTWGTLEHVLLAGDWDTVPTKRVHDSDAYEGWDDGFIPADSYFQCLDGTWDLDGDGLYSEPGDMEDIIPDLSVSRLAINDPRIWEEKVDQIMEYEKSLTSQEWGSTALLIAANTHNYGDGNTHSEYLWDKYLNNTYDDKVPLYEDEGTLSLSAVDQAIEDGVSFIQFVDHGGPTVWCDDYGAGVVFRDRDARELTNSEMLPVISTLACLTTWFDDTSGCQYQRFNEGLGEVFTENTNGGALGYIGSSRTSVGILGANRYLPYDNGLQEDIARQLGGVKEFTLGSAFTDAKMHYAEVWGNQFANNNNKEVSLCWLEFTLLGEPTVDFWTGQNGDLDIEVFHEDDLDPHIQIQVKDEDGNPLQDANVTLQNFERGVFSRIVTDSEGYALFDLELDWFCDINLTVTKHNYLPRRDFIRISDMIAPVTSLVTDPLEPEGENGWYLTDPIISLVPNEKADVHYRFGSGQTGILNSSMNYTIPSIGEGIHDLHFFGEDGAGNLEDETHISIKIDLSTPNITVSMVPGSPDGENGWFGTEPLITLGLNGNDIGAPVNIYYTIDGEKLLYEDQFFVPEGLHSIPIYGVDEAGRTSESIWLDLKVDTTPPETIVDISIDEPDGKNGWYITSPLITLSSNEFDTRVEYRYSTKDQFVSYDGSFHLEDGNHILQYRSIDISGNIGETMSIPLKVDTTDPSTDCKVSPSEPDGLEGFFITNPTIRMDWHDNLGSTLYFSLDGGDWETDITRFEIGHGEHEVQFYAEDDAGNQCPIEEMEFKVDTILPITIFDVRSPDSGGWYKNKPLIELRTDIDAQTIYWWEGKGEVNTYQRPIDVPGREGTFKLHVQSTDRAGNEEDEQVRIFRVDTKEPILRLDTMKQSRNTFLIDCSDSTDGMDIQFRVLEGQSVIADWTSDPNIKITLPDGDHTLTVEVRDEAGNIVRSDIDIDIDPEWLPYVAIGVPVIVLIIIGGVLVLIGIRKRRNDQEVQYFHDLSQNYDHGPERVEVREL